jgi:signal transduction histidine kinase
MTIAAPQPPPDASSNNVLIHAAVQEAVATQGDLVRLLAHDLRGPLTVLRATFNIFERTSGAPADPELVDSGKDAVVRLASMVDSLLTGLESSQISRLPMNDVFDLGELIREAVSDLTVLFRARELAVGLRISEGPRALRGRKDLLRAAVDNLLINAVEHSPLGGEVSIQGGGDGDGGFDLKVSDQGPGVPDELAETIFIPEQWSRLKSRGTRLGRGLGLVVARTGIERHGGTLKLVPPHHRRFGATFELSLPRSSFS